MGEQRQQYSEAFKKDTVRYVQQHKQQKNITDIAAPTLPRTYRFLEARCMNG
ncbi:hypothetical protein [Salibacterium aidingense]|uniref:hypothetical protein n=1 Tax=Salibacterium aidingense TaxID=384933 RepID=UPI00040C276A|nr:hypothetical protein [Salibacterium aidingense]